MNTENAGDRTISISKSTPEEINAAVAEYVAAWNNRPNNQGRTAGQNDSTTNLRHTACP